MQVADIAFDFVNDSVDHAAFDGAYGGVAEQFGRVIVQRAQRQFFREVVQGLETDRRAGGDVAAEEFADAAEKCVRYS